MSSAYHWEARRRQMALDKKRQLAKQEQQPQKDQKPTKFQDDGCQSERHSQPPPESWQEAQPPPARSQPPVPKPAPQKQPSPPRPPPPPQPPPPPLPPPQPSPQPQPRQQNAQDLLLQCTSIHGCQNPQNLCPQLTSRGTQQDGGQSTCVNDKFPGGKKISQDPGFRNSDQLSPDKHARSPRFTSTNYIQQW